MYGYSGDPDYDPSICKSTGVMFRTSPGDTVQIHLAAEGGWGASNNAEVVVKPGRLYTKDNFVGVELDKDLRPIVMWLAAIGSVMVLWAGFLWMRGKFLHSLINSHSDVSR